MLDDDRAAVQELHEVLLAIANGDERTVQLAVSASVKLWDLLDHTGEPEGLRIIEALLSTTPGLNVVLAVVPKDASELLNEGEQNG